MKKLLISVVLPVFNSQDFLRETLKSISAQTWQNWELIAIDDGSTDGSLKILNDYAANEPRLKIISRENRGLARTLNEGIAAAQGEWIARIDADDIALPERFARQIEWAEKSQADVCGGAIERIGVTGKHSWNFPTSDEGICTWLLFRPAFSHPAVIIRRETVLKYPYDESYSHAQDYELWTRLALNRIRMTNLPETVLKYRIHDKQVSHAKRSRQIDLRMKITSNYWQKSPLTHDLKFVPCLLDEREPITEENFKSVFKSLKTLESRVCDAQAIASINLHRIWFVYRSINLGPQIILPALKKLRTSMLKRFAVATLSTLKAGRVIEYFRNADWVRNLPIKWLF